MSLLRFLLLCKRRIRVNRQFKNKSNRLRYSITSERPHISGLTIRLASITEKDGLTFSGNYPSTVINEQELDIGTDLIVSCKSIARTESFD